MVRHKAVLGRYAALRCLWHEMRDDERTNRYSSSRRVRYLDWFGRLAWNKYRVINKQFKWPPQLRLRNQIHPTTGHPRNLPALLTVVVWSSGMLRLDLRLRRGAAPTHHRATDRFGKEGVADLPVLLATHRGHGDGTIQPGVDQVPRRCVEEGREYGQP
eukprot:7389016-Prymnesium_polylepis.2